uniref:dehydrogenase/reductase SDR family member 4-like n=1 Tax=Ciona intestinalis TaxID=7719 RepID=UPI000EF4656A|nr:dehydrogenase/reductase SDR family member 4-like [Ciona intestinalis]|eukprot:XP_009859099.2 dehydrogenase/reductase SDR family member 4-like [Ciona intestinalis]
MDKLLEETIKTFGKLDVLVNNAGIVSMTSVEDYTGESFDKILSINLKAPIYLTKIAKPHLALTKGNIVNMSSVSATRLTEGYSMYGITKSGLSYFTKATAASFAKDGIRCNAICPGLIATDIHGNLMSKELIQTALTVEASLLNGKVATVEDVANMAVFLASEKAAMVTGECIVIDGGRYITKINE